MRVISGDFGGLRLKAVPGSATRPTTDKIKESVFNLIGPYFDGETVLDAYAGSGGLAIESVSRGASHATLIDRQFAAIKTINENIAITKNPELFTVIKGDTRRVFQQLATKEGKFDLLFFDPPYAKQQIIADIRLLEEYNLVSSTATIVCETDRDVELPEKFDQFITWKNHQYGITNIRIYRREV